MDTTLLFVTGNKEPLSNADSAMVTMSGDNNFERFLMQKHKCSKGNIQMEPMDLSIKDSDKQREFPNKTISNKLFAP